MHDDDLTRTLALRQLGSSVDVGERMRDTLKPHGGWASRWPIGETHGTVFAYGPNLGDLIDESNAAIMEEELAPYRDTFSGWCPACGSPNDDPRCTEAGRYDDPHHEPDVILGRVRHFLTPLDEIAVRVVKDATLPEGFGPGERYHVDNATTAYLEALAMVVALEDYPLLSDEDYSERELAELYRCLRDGVWTFSVGDDLAHEIVSNLTDTHADSVTTDEVEAILWETLAAEEARAYRRATVCPGQLTLEGDEVRPESVDRARLEDLANALEHFADDPGRMAPDRVTSAGNAYTAHPWLTRECIAWGAFHPYTEREAREALDLAPTV